VVYVLFAASADALSAADTASVELQRDPPGTAAADMAQQGGMSLGESDDSDPEGAVSSDEQDKNQELRERQDEREAQTEGEASLSSDSELGESTDPQTPDPQQSQQQTSTEDKSAENGDGASEEGGGEEKSQGEHAAELGQFKSNVFVTMGKDTLRVGAAWGMPGVYSSDGGARDLILGTAGGKKIYFGTAKNDAWIQATTGHMWLKGSITVKNYAHFFAEKQRLRVGAAWGMPGIYASDGADRDMIIGTAAGKKIFFGVHRQDAWIEAGAGHMWLKGSLTVKNYGHFLADGQRLRVGAVFGMPGLYASDGENRDLFLGTAAGKKIYFGAKKDDAFIEAGTGKMVLKGGLEAGENSLFKTEKTTLQVGSSYDMPGIYAGASGVDDLSLGTQSGRRIYFGVGKEDSFIQAGTGNMFLKGALTTQENAFFISEKQKLRVGSVDGMPGLFASDGEARDLMLGTDTGRKVYIGKHKADAWIEAGTGNAMLAGVLSTKKSIIVEDFGQKLRVGGYAGMPGLFSSDDGPRDMIIGVAKDRKVYVGEGKDDTYFTAGEGNLWLKGSLETHANMFVYSENQRLRVGSINGMPGIYSSDGAARDMMIGTAKNSKVYFGNERADAWIQAGTGESFFKGAMQVTDNVKVDKNGQTLVVGESFGLPGIYSSDGLARDLMLGVANGKKVHFGYGAGDAYVEGGTGNGFFKGKLIAKDMETEATLTVRKAAFFDDTVTVSKNLILASGGGTMDLAEEMTSMRSENEELRAMVAEMREQMSELMTRQRS